MVYLTYSLKNVDFLLIDFLRTLLSSTNPSKEFSAIYFSSLFFTIEGLKREPIWWSKRQLSCPSRKQLDRHSLFMFFFNIDFFYFISVGGFCCEVVKLKEIFSILSQMKIRISFWHSISYNTILHAIYYCWNESKCTLREMKSKEEKA